MADRSGGRRRVDGAVLWERVNTLRRRSFVLCGLLILLGLSAADHADPIRRNLPGETIHRSGWRTASALRATAHQAPTRPARDSARPAATSASITAAAANFDVVWSGSCATPPEAAETALLYAAGIWGGLLSSPVTIQISACWSSTLPCDGIACADTTSRVRNFPGAALIDTHYPIALASALAGTDLDATRRDITVHFDSGVDWSFATDGSPTGSIDFVSVALHEFAHGLGFTGNMYESYNIGFCGDGPFGFLYPCPTPYDWFTIDSGGVPLLDYLLPDPRDLGGKLKSDALFGGPNATASNGGAPVRLYTPAVWQQGTSLSHLDPIVFEGGENGLMTPSYDGAQRSPGPLTLAMLQDMGWPRGDGAPYIKTSGPLAIGVDQDARVDATLEWAAYAGQAVHYSWTATDQQSISHSGLGVTDSVQLNWGTPGIQSVTVTADGGGVSASATRTALVYDVEASGVAQGEPAIEYTFSASIVPHAAGFPVNFTWEATGLETIIHSERGATDAVTFSWPSTGPKTVTVRASLGGATVHDMHAINIGGVEWNSHVFLPVLQLP